MLTRPLPQGGQPWTPGKSEQKGGKGCVPEEESESRRKGLSRGVHPFGRGAYGFIGIFTHAAKIGII